MSLSLMLGTGIFTLAALGPKLVRANKAKFTSLINLKLYLRSFIDTIQVSKKLSNYWKFQGDPRFILLVVCDVFKTAFSISCLGQTDQITLWFFLMLADGHLIYILNKMVSLFSGNSASADGLKVSKNKLMGIFLVLLGNICLTLFWNPFTCTLAGGYIILSCVEFYLLESATSSQPNTLYSKLLCKFVKNH